MSANDLEFEGDELLLDNEPALPGEPRLPAVGSRFPDFDLQLPDGSKLRVADFIQRGPAIINFIKGIWCPFCQAHMRNIMRWRDALPDKAISLLALSNEPPATIRTWLQANPVAFTFASVASIDTFRVLGLDVPQQDFARPATFVVEPGMIVRLAYAGPRGATLRDAVQKSPVPVAWRRVKRS